VPIVSLTASLLALPLAIAFTLIAATALGATYWAYAGSSSSTRIAIEASLIVTSAIVARYAVSRLESRSRERHLLERIRHASSSSHLLDRVYADIYLALNESLSIDRFAIVVERSGGDELEVAYATGVPVASRELGDIVPLVLGEDGWGPIVDGRVMVISGGRSET
jgi:hypothetical protein